MTKTKFKNANEAYEYLLDKIIQDGVPFGDTKALFNVGFTIENPMQNYISNKERQWKLAYAAAEWHIWVKMANSDGNVMSNYGWQWQRENQIDYVVAKLRREKDTRHAAISIYDCKEHQLYRKDTPCTYAIQFTILNNRLNMAVLMRSNDLWYGFCNDQYQFSMLQQMIAERLNIEIGNYYHYAHNMHLYNDKL